MDIEELKSFAQKIPSVLPERPSISFDPRWLAEFKRRLGMLKPNEPMVFLFPKNVPEAVSKIEGSFLEHREVPFHDPIKPGVLILGTATSTQGWYGHFSDVQTLFVFLKAQGLDCHETVLGTNGQPQMHYFPKGTIDRTSYAEFEVSDLNALTLPVLEAALADFASEKVLNHPKLRADLWTNAAKYYPTENPEKAIQKLLFFGLSMKFSNGIALQEIDVPSGRTDIVFEQKSALQFVRYLLELKTIRDFTHTGKKRPKKANKDWCLSGVVQAKCNGDDIQCDEALLCTYDFTKTSDAALFADIKADAAKQGVKAHLYRVLSSSANVRAARVGKKS